MQPPWVSVVISNYNYGRHLGEAIDSVLSQTYPHRDVVVIDDGSTDQSEVVLKRYGDRIRWLSQPRRGVSAARNRGIQESRGELVAFLDADDVWHPDKLARQVPALADPCVGMVYCRLQYIDAQGRPLGTDGPGSRGRVLRELALFRGPGVPATGSSALVRRSCLERVGGFDPSLSTSADWDLWRRIACHYAIDLIPEHLVGYRLHPTAMHTDVDVFERDMLRAFSKMFEDPDARLVHSLRRRCYGNLHMVLAGSFFRAGQPLKALEHGFKSLRLTPSNVRRVVGMPGRWWRRRRLRWYPEASLL